MNNVKKTISTPEAPSAIGPYSQAIVSGCLLFASGQIPLDPATGEVVSGGIEEQTHRVMKNIGGILKASGVDFSNVVQTNVYLTDLNDFAKMNAIYGEYFAEPYPARCCVQVAGLPKGVKIEVAVTAKLKEKCEK